MIGKLPLWLILALWALQRMGATRMTFWNFPVRLRMIEDMRSSLPVPRSRAEVWLTVLILERLDREKADLLFLRGLGLVATAVVSKN